MSIDSMMTPAPSQRRNPWFQIIFFSLTAWAITATGLAAWSFEWLSPALWAQVDHLSYWQSFAKSFFSGTAKADWQGYLGWIDHHGLSWHLYLHVGVPALIGILPAIATFIAFYTPGGADALRHVSGPLLYRHRRAIRNAKWKLWWRYAFDPMGKGVEFYPGLFLPMRREPQNILYLGMPGTGKTQTMNKVMKQAIDRGDRVLIYDEKKEFTEFFYGYGEHKTLLIAPWDKRSVKWNIAADCRTKSQAQLFANRAIASTDKDPIWGKGVRLILTGGIVSLNKRFGRKWGFEHLGDFKNMEIEEMEELMKKYYPPAARFIKENSKTTDSFLMNLSTDLSWLDDLAEAWPGAWEKSSVSFRGWTKNDETRYRTIILQNDSEYPDVAAPLVNVLVALVTSTLLKMGTSKTRRLWLFLDEIGNLPKNESLLKWMSLARAKGGRMVLGIQDLAMMEEVYGTNILKAKKSMIGTVIALPVSEMSDTAEDTARALGKRNVERPQSTRQADGSVSVTWQAQNDVPLVTASELSNLPEASPKNGIHGFVKINGLNTVYQLRWPLEPMPQIAEGDVPADWTIPPDDYDEDPEQALMAAISKPVCKTKEKANEEEVSVEDEQFINKTPSPLSQDKESDTDHLATETAEGMLESEGLGGISHALELFSESADTSASGDNNIQAQSDTQRRGRKRRKEAELEHE